MMGYKPTPIPFQQAGQHIGRNLLHGYQNRQQLPWARPDWQGAPQGAAMMRSPGVMGGVHAGTLPGQGRPTMGTMPAQPMQGGMNPMDMWNMIKQGRQIT
jgi:hypothetical protein